MTVDTCSAQPARSNGLIACAATRRLRPNRPTDIRCCAAPPCPEVRSLGLLARRRLPGRRRPHPLSTLGISQQVRSTIYLLAGRAHASSDIAGGRPRGSDGAAISGVHSMSDYSRRGRKASGPPLVISKYSQASARTSSIALLCPPAPPALGREFRFQKAMMALAPAEIALISGQRSLSG